MVVSPVADSPVITGKVIYSKQLSLASTDQIKVLKNGVADADMDYTVTTGKSNTVTIAYSIKESAA